MTPRFYFLLCGAVLVAAAAASGTYCANVFGIHQSSVVGRKEALDGVFSLPIVVLYVPAALIALIAAAVAQRRSVKMALVPFVIGMASSLPLHRPINWSDVLG